MENLKYNSSSKKTEEKRRWVLVVIIILMLLLLLLFFEKCVWSFPSTPKIAKVKKNWEKEKIIQVTKKSKSRKGVNYYEWCARGDKDFSKCEWQKTKTQNMSANSLKTGEYYIVFRAVSNNGRKSKKSNFVKVLIDYSSPIIKNIKIKQLGNGRVKVIVDATDKDSKVKKYYYRLNGGKLIEVDDDFIIKGLDDGKDYKITIVVEDEAGNKSEVEQDFTYKDDEKTDYNSKDNKADKRNDSITKKPTSNDKKNSQNNNGNSGNNPGDGNTENKEDDKKIPKINIDEVPLNFDYGSEYKLPSYYEFGKKGGSVSCLVDGKEYNSTKKLPLGINNIECYAYGNNGMTTKVEKEVTVNMTKGANSITDGWIRINLSYPENSYNREWRIGNENEIRDGYGNSGWKPYTGPILVKLSDVDDVYIRYDLDGETKIVSSNGKPVVSIEADKKSLRDDEIATIEIYYDDAEVKEYKINDGEWTEYKEDFEVSKNTLISARISKKVIIYNSNGVKTGEKIITNSDSLWIGEVLDNIDDENTGAGDISGGNGVYEPDNGEDGEIVTKPTTDSKPTDYLEGPKVTVNPTTVSASVKVKITPNEEAEDIYYRINNDKWKKYEGEVTLTENAIVSSYYVRKSDGKKSDTAYKDVDNIHIGNTPYVKINASSDYLNNDISEVEVRLSGSNYNKLEYSYDGVIYYSYTGALIITNSTRVYARGVNNYGTTVVYKDITTTQAPIIKENYDVSIAATPEVSSELVGKTEVTINYDKNITDKYYKIDSGEWQKYTGNFELTSNATIYAYGFSENGNGSAEKKIDFLYNGISSPVISVTPSSTYPTTKVEVSIKFDKNATEEKYKIGESGTYYDYVEPFEVDYNTVVYATNKNIVGNEKQSSKEISNIGTVTTIGDYLVTERDNYVLVKLIYPDGAENKKYKWKENGAWKSYPTDGILFVKPEAKDKVLNSSGKVEIKIEDENGSSKIFNGDNYLLDVKVEEIVNNLYKSWDVKKVEVPKIVVGSSNYSKEQKVTIEYAEALETKLYKLITPTKQTEWLPYIGEFLITEKDTVVYAKGVTSNDIESEVAFKVISNVDREKPEIEVAGDFSTPKQAINVQVIGNDDSGEIKTIKWEKGKQDEEYFTDKGNKINNKETIQITENGIYTFFIEDEAGNVAVKVVKITNIDKNAPNIVINVLTPEYGAEAEIEIDFGDSKTKEYRIGNSGNYKTYSGKFKIKAVDVAALKNSDGSVTIYARGVDTAGNTNVVQEAVRVLDLTIPKTPVIYAGSGFPIITEYGIKIGTDTRINFDTGDGIENYYSIDNGKTWKKYTGPFALTSGKIMAKSVRSESGVTSISDSTIAVPNNALQPAAYDGNASTYDYISGQGMNKYAISRIELADSLQGKSISLSAIFKTVRRDLTGNASGFAYVKFVNASGSVINEIEFNEFKEITYDDRKIDIPKGAKYIDFWGPYYSCYGCGDYYIKVSEIDFYTTPMISHTKFYPKLDEYGVNVGYVEATIKYDETAVERLYRINSGPWQDYRDMKIRLEIGQKLEAKGINKYGKETKIASLTAALPGDAMLPAAYDGKADSYDAVTGQNIGKYDISRIELADTMQEKSISLTANFKTISQYLAGNATGFAYVKFVNASGSVINEIEFNEFKEITYDDRKIDIPKGAKYIDFWGPYYSCSGCGNYYIYIKEIGPYTTPILSNVKKYPLLTTKRVNVGYVSTNIKYDETSVSKLYRINNGEWNEYKGETLKLFAGQTIQAKGIDKNGKQSRVNTFTASIPSDSLEPAAYDGNPDSFSYISGQGKQAYAIYKVEVDAEMQGKSISLTANFKTISQYLAGNATGFAYIKFTNAIGGVINVIEFSEFKEITYNNQKIEIPNGTKYIEFWGPYYSCYGCGDYYIKVREIGPYVARSLNQRKIPLNNVFTEDKMEAVIKFPEISLGQSDRDDSSLK